MVLRCQPATVTSHGCTSTARLVAAAMPELRFAAGRPLMKPSGCVLAPSRHDATSSVLVDSDE